MDVIRVQAIFSTSCMEAYKCLEASANQVDFLENEFERQESFEVRTVFENIFVIEV